MKFSTATLVTILLELTVVDPTDAAASSVSSIRGVTSTQQRDDKAWSTTHFGTTRTHRHLGQDNADCLMVERSTFVEHDTEFEDHSEGEGLSRAWVCEFPFAVAQSELRGHVFIDIDMDDVPVAMIDSMGAQSGASILRTTGAYVEELLDTATMAHMWTMHVPSTASMEVISIDSEHGSQHSRRLTSYSNTRIHTGALSVLVVKVIANGTSIDATNEELYNDFFLKEHSLKTGMESCSIEQLIIEPAADRDGDDGESGVVSSVVNGVTSVVVEATQNAIEAENGMATVLEELAISNLSEEYGNISSEYDLVILCLPPRERRRNWYAYAYINSWLSVYDDRYCQSYQIQMHEIGHNLGFAHSRQAGERGEYGDESGFMGGAWHDVKMCFNAPKNFQSGWYTDAQESFDPLENQNSVVERTLIGIDDYQVSSNNNGNLVTLRLGAVENDASDSTGDDYYVGFNLAEGINEGTLEGGNQVLIFHKQVGGPTQYGQSNRIADLDPGESYTIQGFKGTSDDVTISVKPFENDGRTAPIEISTNKIGRFKIDLSTDLFGTSMSWRLLKTPLSNNGVVGGDGEENDEVIVIGSGQPNRYYRGTVEYTFPEDGQYFFVEESYCYVFEIMDSHGDGICCEQGFGSYKGYLDGIEIFEGGDSHSIDTSTYCVPADTNAPSNAPTDVPTDVPSSTPTNAPTEKPCSFDLDCRKAEAGRCYYEKHDGEPGRFLNRREKCPNGQCFCQQQKD